MTPRLDIERRLLAALFLWPCAVKIEARHFLAPEHGVIFDAIDYARVEFPGDPLPDPPHGYDDCTLAIVVGLARQRSLEVGAAFGRARWHAADFARWVGHYITHTLMRAQVTSQAIPDLVEQVRVCPRCGR